MLFLEMRNVFSEGEIKMTALMKIQSFIQAYVQAIASILEADVTVVDNELVRVAGTGVYADEIISCIRRELQENILPLDPVYTGKAHLTPGGWFR